MDDEQLEYATIRQQNLVMELIEEGLSPLAVASIVQASATKMYRAMLDDKEFEDLMITVMNNRSRVCTTISRCMHHIITVSYDIILVLVEQTNTEHPYGTVWRPPY